MNGCLRANLPIVQSQLQPSVPDFSLLKAKEEEKKRNQKRVFNSWHAVQDLDPLFPDEVWIPDHNTTGHVVELIAPRSYHVSFPTGTLRHNHAHLRHMPTLDRETAESPNVNPHSEQ